MSRLADFGEVFVAVLHHENDRGVKAVIDTLKELGIMHYDYERMSFKFQEIEVSGQVLEHVLDKKLGKR